MMRAISLHHSLTALLIQMPLDGALGFLDSLFKNWNFQTKPGFAELMLVYALPVFVMHLYVASKDSHSFKIKNPFLRLAPRLREGVLALLVFLIISNPGSPTAFVYFQF